MRLTVGPLPPAVYWRRRAIVLGVALLALFLVAQACMASAPADDRGAAGEPSPTAGPATPTPVPATPSPGGDSDAAAGDNEGGGDGGDEGGDEDPDEPADADRCADDEIEVTAQSNRDTLLATEGAQFTLRVAAAADRTCQRDIGGDQRELYLVRGSGADHVWSSRWCANPSGAEVVEMSPGFEPQVFHIAFTGFGGRGCDAELAAGDYRLYARLGTALSEPVEITLQ